MKQIIELLHNNHKKFWNKSNILSLLFSLLFFGLALFIQKIADNYVIETGGTRVGDILLNNIAVRDIDGFIILSVLTFTFIMILLLLSKPKYTIFVIKSLSLFIIIRAFFISLTHLGIQPHQINFSPNSFGFGLYDLLYNSKNDFFFSGHTGLPFLIALIFYDERFWRNTFFITSIVFGLSVIIGHIHYSIDVFAAPFITYTIYCISKKIFKKDYELTK